MKNTKSCNITFFATLAAFLWTGTGYAQEETPVIKSARKAISEQRNTNAVAILEPLVKRNNPDALNLYSLLCLKNHVAGCSAKDAEAMLLKSAKLGSNAAQYNLAILYMQGHGIEQSRFKAQRWLKKAAKAGHPAAQYSLGKLHLTGAGVRRDASKGWKLVKLASNQGVSPAQYDLAETYSAPRKYSRSVAAEVRHHVSSRSEARQLMMSAAKAGYPPAQLGFGTMHLYGYAGPGDSGKARFWINEAIKSGIPEILARAQELDGEIRELEFDQAIAAARKSLNKWLSVKENRDAAILAGLAVFMLGAGEQIRLSDCENPDMNYLSSESVVDCQNRVRDEGQGAFDFLFLSK